MPGHARRYSAISSDTQSMPKDTTKDAQRCQEKYDAMPAMPGDARRDSKARMKNDITLNKKKICKEGRHFRAMTCDAQPYEAVKKRKMPSNARRDTQR